MAGRIETLLAAEHRLLQDVSHELRLPLTRLVVAVNLAITFELSGDRRNLNTGASGIDRSSPSD
jgi:two-component system sensor histidine kinase CpxA